MGVGLTYDGGGEETDSIVRGRAGGVEGLDKVDGKGEGDDCLAGRLHDHQRRP